MAFLLLTVVLVGVSGGLLWALGLNYDGISGSAPSKIHPATYMAVALVGWTMLRAGNPVIPVAQALNRRPACVLLATCGVLLLVLIAARGGTGLAGSIDTFVLAGLIPILLMDRDTATLRRIETIFHLMMLANALLGLFEFASGQRFFPFRFDGMAFETDTRSAALQGHPLVNATLTACYILALANGGGRLSPALRAGMIAVQLVALVTFGGRSATVTTLALGGMVGLFALNRTLRSNRIPLIGAACACFVLTNRLSSVSKNPTAASTATITGSAVSTKQAQAAPIRGIRLLRRVRLRANSPTIPPSARVVTVADRPPNVTSATS